MYECVPGSVCDGDPQLVRSELSVKDNRRRHRPTFRKDILVPFLLGCALINYGCANDDDTHREHRHRHRHGEEQVETVDRSNSSNPTPTPPARW
jgi:hypothetical protein